MFNGFSSATDLPWEAHNFTDEFVLSYILTIASYIFHIEYIHPTALEYEATR